MTLDLIPRAHISITGLSPQTLPPFSSISCQWHPKQSTTRNPRWSASLPLFPIPSAARYHSDPLGTAPSSSPNLAEFVAAQTHAPAVVRPREPEPCVLSECHPPLHERVTETRRCFESLLVTFPHCTDSDSPGPRMRTLCCSSQSTPNSAV